jgi:16S rRNA (adenine1518-N6/adenine1519-N6)-dimethyltransferase
MAGSRKRFGQHFLHDLGVLQQMIIAIRPLQEDVMVEIGPGRGALTAVLLPQLRHLMAVEIDRDLVPLLQKRYAADKLTVYQADVLTFRFQDLVRDGHDLRIVGNLPYNISTPLLFHLYASISCIDDMHFLLQKEVAVRMGAAVGSAQYGRLSVMTQYYCEVIELFDVAPESFQPPPKVNSTFVRLLPHRQHALTEKQYYVFSQLVRHVFTMRRKTLRNSLKVMLPKSTMDRLTINLSARPQELSVEQYVSLSQQIELE